MTQKIITGLLAIASGKRKTLSLGSTAISRDWLWASDAAEAVAAITSAPQPGDYIVASGKSSTLDEFVTTACVKLELNPKEVVTHDESLFRPSDIESISLNPAKATQQLGWNTRYDLDSIVEALLADDIGPDKSGSVAN